MMAVKPKKHLIVLSVSVFIIILLSSYYQSIQQQNHNTEKNELVRKENFTFQNFLGMMKSYIQTEALGYNQGIFEDDFSELSVSDLPELSPADRRPRPTVAPITSDYEHCMPYFKNMHVQPVPEHDCEQPYVLMSHGGRLGNILCEYASLYLLRYLYGIRVAIQVDMKSYLDRILKNVFLPTKEPDCFPNITKNLKYEAVYMKIYKTARQARDNSTHKNLITVPLLNESYAIWDGPAPRALFMDHRDLLRSLIRFKDEVISQATQHINEAIRSFNATYQHRGFHIVTVHVRRTDYTGYIKGTFNLTELDDLYFKRAIQFYKERLNQPVFLVVSDDPSWCKQNLQAQDVIVVASAIPTVDMAVMSLGDHHITSYGTFSFTGALLGRGHIMHPIGHNRRYNLVDCVRSPFFHHISRDETYEVDNSRVRLV